MWMPKKEHIVNKWWYSVINKPVWHKYFWQFTYVYTHDKLNWNRLRYIWTMQLKKLAWATELVKKGHFDPNTFVLRCCIAALSSSFVFNSPTAADIRKVFSNSRNDFKVCLTQKADNITNRCFSPYERSNVLIVKARIYSYHPSVVKYLILHSPSILCATRIIWGADPNSIRWRVIS